MVWDATAQSAIKKGSFMRRLACHLIVPALLLALPTALAAASPPEGTDSGLTAVFVRYYSAIAKERWSEAFQMMHTRLKEATAVQTPEDLARHNSRTQQELIDAFGTYDRLEVATTEMDLNSIKARVTAAGNGDVAGEVSYDLVVFPKGQGRPLMYRATMNVGLAQGQIIRITQHSMARIDSGGHGDAI
jgi:hypothetical protein